MLHILRSLSRICNVFLTKMDVLLPATFSMNSLPDLLLLVNAEHKMLYCLIRILRTARLICCSSMRNRDNAILPVTHYRNSPPDLLLVKPVRKSSSSKLDALLPATFSMNSLSDLLLLVNAEHKMLYCLKRILKTARPNFFPHAQIIEKRVILWYNYSIYPSDTYLIPRVVSD